MFFLLKLTSQQNFLTKFAAEIKALFNTKKIHLTEVKSMLS